MTLQKLSFLTLFLALAVSGPAFGQATLGDPAPGSNRNILIEPKQSAAQPSTSKTPTTVINQTLPAAEPGSGQPASPPVVVTQPGPQPYTVYPIGSCNGNGCGSHGHGHCNVQWLKPWTCDDLKMEPVEVKHHCGCHGFLHGLLWCPPEPEEKEEENGNGEKKNGNGNGETKNGNGNGEKKNGNGKNGAKKNGNGEKKNGNGNGEKKNGDGEKKENGNGEEKEEEEEAEEPETPTPLMAWIQCRFPGLYNHMDCNGVKTYGWIQAGFTANFDSPNDRLNYGTNFNNRSNDFLLNQAYIVLEKPLDLDKKKDCFHVGYRVDFFFGHDAPYWENLLGIFPNFTGDRLEVSRLADNGISIPQLYADFHLPVLTDRGIDIRVGRFYTLMGHEVNPAPSTYFYSHNYEFFYAMPFTHTGALAIAHLGDTVDFYNGVVRGWDVAFSDTNDALSYTGGVIWNACDKRSSFNIAWITGAEQLNNNDNSRTVVCAYYNRQMGTYNEWRFITGGYVGWEQNGSLDPSGTTNSAEWYGYTAWLFYTINPKWTLGARAEWFRDDDGARTGFANSDNGGALWNRPGYAGNFYDLTFGVTYKPYQNLRIRPEIRFDWFDGQAIDGSGSRPFNDQRDNFQTTLGIDMIWEF